MTGFLPSFLVRVNVWDGSWVEERDQSQTLTWEAIENVSILSWSLYMMPLVIETYPSLHVSSKATTLGKIKKKGIFF